MSLRIKLALALASLSAIATVALGLISYRSTANSLNDQVDDTLRRGAEYVQRESSHHSFLDLRFATSARRQQPGDAELEGDASDPDGDAEEASPGGPSRDVDGLLVQLVSADGTVYGSPISGEFAVSADDLSVAAGDRSEIWHDVGDNENRLRILTVAVPGGAVQLARSLVEVDRTLDTVRHRMVLTVLIVTAAAAVLGWLTARQVSRRLVSLTEAAERVASSGNPAVTVPAAGTDEAARLGAAMNRMLSSLAESKRAQEQLVQDVGHELRTPLTSLRTNLAVLRRHPEMAAEQRARLFDDLDSESRELTGLINEIVDSSNARQDDAEPIATKLLDGVERLAIRVTRRSGRAVHVQGSETTALLRPGSLERTVGNLLDNAAKFDDSNLPIEVTVGSGRIVVRDHGSGFETADLPKVFDRFYRATAARSRPGSGLGLGIVRDVVERHGGTVAAANHPDGGAMVTITFPPSAPASQRA